MSLTTCPLCGSTALIWDYTYGYVVCSNCGYVIERLMYGAHIECDFITIRNESTPPSRWVNIKERVHNYSMKLRKARKEIQEYERCSRGSTKSKSYISRFVHELEFRKSIDSIMSEEVKRLLSIISEDPVLSSRTLRGKIALALMLKDLAEGREPDIALIAYLTKLSKAHVRRLYSLLKSRMERIRIVLKA